MYFYINGVKTPVVVDDQLPCNEDGSVAFAYSDEDAIWVSLLEKAWAKLHGTYVRTEEGWPYFAYT